jgi:cell division protein FtsB
MTHTLKSRQRNDAELAKNERKIELLQLKINALNAEMADLRTEERALLAMAVVLRDAGGQL